MLTISSNYIENKNVYSNVEDLRIAYLCIQWNCIWGITNWFNYEFYKMTWMQRLLRWHHVLQSDSCHVGISFVWILNLKHLNLEILLEWAIGVEFHMSSLCEYKHFLFNSVVNISFGLIEFTSKVHLILYTHVRLKLIEAI